MSVKTPRLVIAGLSGDSGKTIVTLSLLIALRRKGYSIAPFKKGPDFIDPAWLSIVSGTDCRNLDTYMVGPDNARRSFALYSVDADISVIEGNRGLFDGKDISGTHSTAELAKLLQAPLLLVVDATKATRTIAALIKGCLSFDSEISIAGVVINKVAGPRHEKTVRESIEEYCAVTVVGAIPKLGNDASLLPGRHLGLIPPAELVDRVDIEAKLADIADRYLDVEKIFSIAAGAKPLTAPIEQPIASANPHVRIGFFKDSVFTFYYPDNLEALERMGASLAPVSSLTDTALPEIDALYIGGGFPETHAELLARNRSLMESVRSAADRGMPIYAECGGLIYLCRSLTWADKKYAMAGLFPIDLEMRNKPVGHGYTLLHVDQTNPFYPVGATIKGHEFHYSGIAANPDEISGCTKVLSGVGLGNGSDGLLYKRTMACYTHIHADGTKDWAASMIANAERYSINGHASTAGRGSTASVGCAGLG